MQQSETATTKQGDVAEQKEQVFLYCPFYTNRKGMNHEEWMLKEDITLHIPVGRPVYNRSKTGMSARLAVNGRTYFPTH